MTTLSQLRENLLLLLGRKQEGMRVDNPLHDCAVKLAQGLLALRFPGLEWETAGANESGIDIRGSQGSTLLVACGVKGHDKYKGNRTKNIDKDLRRLQDCMAPNKFFAVCYPELVLGLRSSPKAKLLLSGVEVLNLLEETKP